MPATRPRPDSHRAHGGVYAAVAVTTVIISLAVAALVLCLWDRYRKRGARMGVVIDAQSYNRATFQGLHPAKDLDGLETGVIHRGPFEEPPRHQEK